VRSRKCGTIVLSIGLSCAATLGTATADPSAKEVVQFKKTELSQGYISGMGQAFVFANEYLSVAGQRRIYCPPGKLGITQDQYLGILEQYLKTRPDMNSQPAPLALLLALREAFPCQ
jgi:hypothetical protein